VGDEVEGRIERFRKVLDGAPDNLFARFGMANACFEAGRLSEAAEQYRHCLAAQGDWMAVHIALGRCLVRLGRKDEARTILEAARVLAMKQGHSQPLDEIREILAEIN